MHTFVISSEAEESLITVINTSLCAEFTLSMPNVLIRAGIIPLKMISNKNLFLSLHMSQITESINLIQGFYSYLLLSLYTDVLMKQGKIPLPTSDVILPTTTKT